MDYTEYSVEDFAKDEYFQRWVLSPDDATRGFWREWILRHPHKKKVVNQAVALIESIVSDVDLHVGELPIDSIWKRILERRNRTELPQSVRRKKIKKTTASKSGAKNKSIPKSAKNR